jgi:hypothetical protein
MVKREKALGFCREETYIEDKNAQISLICVLSPLRQVVSGAHTGISGERSKKDTVSEALAKIIE